MTKQEAIKILERDCPKRPQKLWSVKRTEAIHMAIEALKTRTDGDTISRRDAISAIKKDIMGGLNYESILEELPSAQPCKIHITGTRKFVSNIDLDEPELEKGEWIPNWMHHNGHEPEENDEYLVTWSGYIGNKITKPMLSICEYNDEWITEDIEKYGYNNVMIHAYMPLPEPYKERDNG